MSSNKTCEICSNTKVHYSVHFENKCPVDNCTINFNENRRNHIICKKCFENNKNQIEFDEEKANKNSEKLKLIIENHTKDYNDLIGIYLKEKSKLPNNIKKK